MGAYYGFACGACGFVTNTAGPWEFYRDAEGVRHAYGHPTPVSEEAREAGIAGLTGLVLCLGCGRRSKVTLVEFAEPTHDTLAMWWGAVKPKEEYKQEGAVTCPRCGCSDLLLEPPHGRKAICPKCCKGELTGDMIWTS